MEFYKSEIEKIIAENFIEPEKKCLGRTGKLKKGNIVSRRICGECRPSLRIESENFLFLKILYSLSELESERIDDRYLSGKRSQRKGRYFFVANCALKHRKA